MLDWALLTDERKSSFDAGLVSCLCVTRGRAAHVKRAVRCFLAQTYKNRELVVVHEGLDAGAQRALAPVGDRLTLVFVPPRAKKPLGTLRNLGIRASRGDYVLGWDDDDWYAPRRIELQLRHLVDSHASACALNRWLMFDETTGRAYLSGRRIWEGSLLCRRDLPHLKYPPLARAEDRELVRRLRVRCGLELLDSPFLYVYVFHGTNTWGFGHFRRLFGAGTELSGGESARIQGVVSGLASRSPAKETRAAPR